MSTPLSQDELDRIDDILDDFGHRIVNNPDEPRHILKAKYKQALAALIEAERQQARIDGRRIQAEADKEKWHSFPYESDYVTYLEGQIEAHRYELSQLQATNKKEDV